MTVTSIFLFKATFWCFKKRCLRFLLAAAILRLTDESVETIPLDAIHAKPQKFLDLKHQLLHVASGWLFMREFNYDENLWRNCERRQSLLTSPFSVDPFSLSFLSSFQPSFLSLSLFVCLLLFLYLFTPSFILSFVFIKIKALIRLVKVVQTEQSEKFGSKWN